MRVTRALSLVLWLSAVVVMTTEVGTAPAATFEHEGKALEGQPKFALSGDLGFATAFGSFVCRIHINSETTTFIGHIYSLQFTTEECEGSGLFAECELEDDEPTDLPWIYIVFFDDLIIPEYEVHHEFDSECSTDEALVTSEDVTLTPTNPEAISMLEVSGEGIGHLFGLEVEVTLLGTLEVVGAAAGTYGIGE